MYLYLIGTTLARMIDTNSNQMNTICHIIIARECYF